jgi:uncharacterized membrane protein
MDGGALTWLRGPLPVATLLIAGREWLWPAVGGFVLILGVLVWSYRRAAGSTGLRVACFILKLLGLLALAACLLEPLWVGQRAKPGANYFAVLVDNSRGLQVRDFGETQTRAEQVQQALATGETTWLARLGDEFQLRRYAFDARLHAARHFEELDFAGRASALGAALRGVADRFHGQPLAGVLLFTDGIATDLPRGAPDPAGLPPIYPVVLGGESSLRDLAIDSVNVSETAFEDAPVTIQTQVRATGYGGRRVVARVLDTAGRTVQEQSQRLSRAEDPLLFRLQLRPEHGGLSLYELRVSAQDDPDPAVAPDRSPEATLINNQRVVVVDRRGGPYRVLYVSGRPNWEFKFLNRALAADEQVQLVGLIRVAQREPKFEFRGRVGESSNPLFRGFDRQTEQTERYDQPVLVRLSTRDALELAGGFPKGAAELYAYHAVVLDDLEAGFFTADQTSLLQKFVSERGGGFLMLAGAESFREGQYDRTPIGAMLPVYLDRDTTTVAVDDVRFTLTREGWLQPWLRLHPVESADQTRLEQMPAFHVVNTVRDVKPGASVLAIATDQRHRTYPALVTQRFGLGRVGALLLGDLWRWGLSQETAQADLQKAWRQMIRWLVADVPERVVVQAEPDATDPAAGMQLQVRARDRQFQPLDNATVTLQVRHVPPRAPGTNALKTLSPPPATNTFRLSTEPSLSEAGLYETRFAPREEGAYIAEAVVTDADGNAVGRAETGWSANPTAEEFRSLVPNRALLADLARQTGGRILTLSDLDRFAEDVPRRAAPISESWSSPLWHRPAVFLFALGCFLAEWGLRRWRGLA